MRFALSEVAGIVGGELIGAEVGIDGVSVDSRTLRAGELFVPLVAERDGHDFIGDAVAAVTGNRPELGTGGGTSDARFIKSVCPVAEFGLVGKTMHKTDERVAIDDMRRLADIYRGVLERYFAS